MKRKNFLRSSVQIGSSLVLASANPDKLMEFSSFLAPAGIRVIDMRAAGFHSEMLEDADTFEENATKKAESVARALGVVALADDSGLVVPALGGAPGVRSARYAGEKAADKEHYLRLLEEMRSLEGARREAFFVCVLALATPGQPTRIFRAERAGFITKAPRGDGGFGYDPVFFDPELGGTYAENPAGKRRLSHRAQALRMLLEYLRK